jgi:hypothetical protein
MSSSAFHVVESGCHWSVVQAGIVRGCVASREQALTLVGILEAMADARSASAAYQQEAA